MDHGAIRATGVTAEMTDAEYRQAITVKYARLPRIYTDAEITRQRRLAAAIVRGNADRARGLAWSARQA